METRTVQVKPLRQVGNQVNDQATAPHNNDVFLCKKEEEEATIKIGLYIRFL